MYVSFPVSTKNSASCPSEVRGLHPVDRHRGGGHTIPNSQESAVAKSVRFEVFPWEDLPIREESTRTSCCNRCLYVTRNSRCRNVKPKSHKQGELTDEHAEVGGSEHGPRSAGAILHSPMMAGATYPRAWPKPSMIMQNVQSAKMP